jgi:hypothetical protein
MTMHSNSYWLIFLGLIFLCIAGYTLLTAIKLWEYFRWDQSTMPQGIQWSVAALSDEAFAPLAHYRYQVKGKMYQGQTQLKETYLNEWAAQEAISRLSHSPLTVWFDSSSPEISSLQKHFPLKEALSSLFLWILGIYFAFLGYYVKLRSN